MKIDQIDHLTYKIFDLHIRILKDILLQKPFDQIIREHTEEIQETRYLEIIKKSGHLCFDDNDILIGAYPVSPTKSDYLVKLDEHGVGYSMCAIDALGLAFTFMRKTTIQTIDKSTEKKIEITIDPNSEKKILHNLFVTYQDTPDELQGTRAAANVQCPTINFYSSRKDIPDGLQIWDYERALNYSQMRFSQQEMQLRIQRALDSLSI
ncbi:MAG: organomercurial lyase [Candidatus Kariarchaeaceae archaeon]|jgi:hypothetical protein